MYLPERKLVGQMSVVGDCYCFGLALQGVMPVYLDLAGTAEAVKAVWARLVQGKECRIMTASDALVMQPPGEGLYMRLQRKIEGLSIDHLVMVHKAMSEPLYEELSTTYLLFADKDQASAKLGAHVASLVKVAVFETWHPYLVAQGRMESLVTKCTCYGGVQVWAITLDIDRWTRLIQNGLQHNQLHLP